MAAREKKVQVRSERHSQDYSVLKPESLQAEGFRLKSNLLFPVGAQNGAFGRTEGADEIRSSLAWQPESECRATDR